ncbi:MAG: hypothetical protein CVV64_08835 [Candidatus Wallbacteria bacterium HGW-Wallbacteria-1]|jgi:septum site-determining protein MinD|uniref:Pilus assembly protein TadA n=1 Tax=Candidatus Wallbacteria bacterium HGW-Wallbacteria-1 TaxID=2013854 RepID=A0A2N1PQ46_9BACT|nr:MAG: hypothetical protein CVV64_08835 [Candidatus Wallbacteria bacterium HGW-Wallbacteria-1]
MASGLTLALFSTKGGVGKTTIALNLAHALKDKGEGPIALVDFNISKGGDIFALIDVSEKGVRSIHDDVFPNITSFGPDMIRNFFHSHNGIDIIPFVTDSRTAKRIFFNIEKSYQIEVWQKLNNTLSALAQYYSHIIVDCSCMFTSFALPVLDNSDYILLVLEPDILSIDQSKWFLEEMKHLNFPISKVKLLVNKLESRQPDSLTEVTKLLGKDVFAVLERDDKLVRKALHETIPFMTRFSMSKLRSDMEQLAGKLQKLPPTLISDDLAELMFNASDGEITEDRSASDEQITEFKRRVHQILVDSIDMKQNISDRELRELVDSEINRIFSIEEVPVHSRDSRDELKREIIDEILGLGPLEDLLADSTVDEIMVNRPDQIYIEEKGKLRLSDKKFLNEEQIMAVIERILMPIGKSINELNPFVDGRLRDGSRINAIIRPLAIDSPMITIRKFSKSFLTMEQLIANCNAISRDMATFMKILVKMRKNIIISGGTGTGKTTFLNILSGFIDEHERIITIEDSAELKLQQAHIGRLETRTANVEGKGIVAIRDLVRNALRMRPDRIIVGECRGEEALDMLQAMNTGHDGSISTVHANSPQDALSRLETMVLMAGMELPARAIREQITSAIDIIVQVARLGDGSRKIVRITEVAGIDNLVIGTNDIFTYRQTGVDSSGKIEGNFIPTGYVPEFVKTLAVHGFNLNESMFTPPEMHKKDAGKSQTS